MVEGHKEILLPFLPSTEETFQELLFLRGSRGRGQKKPNENGHEFIANSEIISFHSIEMWPKISRIRNLLKRLDSQKNKKKPEKKPKSENITEEKREKEAE